MLTPFPYTNLSGQKVRPALVVSRTDRMGSDVVLAFITTYSGGILVTTDLLIEDSDPDLPQTGLKRASVVKLDKLVIVEASVVIGELGQLSPALLEAASEKLRYALKL